MGMAPAKIMLMVILFFEAAISPNTIIVTLKVNKQVYGKIVILQSIGIIVIESRETRAVIYT